MTAPSHIAVLFDGEHENARAALDAEYKANRIDYGTVADEDCPFTQLPDIYAVLDYLGIKHAETTACETDDWIAGYALTHGKDMQIVISSFDSDYFQLITDNVSVLRYRGVKTAICTPNYVTEHFGISPDRYADFKSLVGDGSDNIKGAYKVGPKTAAELFKKFGTLETLIDNAEQIERASVRDAITSATDRLRTNYKLIKLENYAPLPFGIDELVHGDIRSSSSDILKKVGILP
ncbi:MAG: flap endonuclease [Clostridiales bacterium]|nr:flap endonuclease [Clostridiales bacterium]